MSMEIAAPARSAQDYLELEELIRWLALPFAGAEPIFAFSNWDGTPIDSGERLRRVWHRVIGTGTIANESGTWVRCNTCGAYSVHSAPLR